ncbi:unnamed protein product [Phytophthora fragariaefolia]|uniref:Unnamed protein product n=1 Tax=Phytophthora fragariaefolia TaxID=1490495 RepID=A0A9W6XH86_9STRA|nr:unnamed protein product [Phytophthora fragariaefolia]
MASGERKAKVRMVQATDDEPIEDSATEAVPQPPQRKKQTEVTRRTKGAVRGTKTEPQSVGSEQKVPRWPTADTKCYACGAKGHFARECPGPEARARNDAYLASWTTTQTPPRGQAAGGGVQASGVDEDGDGQTEGPTVNRYPTLGRELHDADALCELHFGGAADQEIKDGDEQVVQSGESMAAHDGDTVDAKVAASVRLDEELEGRDEERAQRYVRPTATSDKEMKTEEGDSLPMDNGGLTAEEGDGLPTHDDGPTAENGDTPVGSG